VFNLEVENNHNYFANGILVHNCHHSTAVSYSSVYAHMLSDRCKHLGVTATPDRADEQALGKVFQTVAYDYELPQIIADGWLVPIKQRLVTVTGLNYSNVKTTAGDLNQGDVAAAQANETILHEMIHPIVELAGTRKTIVFATPGSKKPTESDDGFHIAERMTEILNRYKPNSARRVSQDTPKDIRRQMLKDFADGKFQYLVNVGVLTEGFDDPSIEVVAITRPTKSRSLYAQMIGRGTRPLPGTVDQYEHAHERKHAIATSMKPHVEVLDFVGNSGRHKLVNTADILGGKYEQEVIDRAEKKAKEETVDMSEALQEAHDELKAEREKAKRARILAQTKFKVESVDPFDVFDIQPVRERQWDIGKPPTTAQLLALQKLGIPVVKDLSRSRAGQLLSEAYRRVDEGLVSFKQIAKGAKPDMKLTELNQDRFKNWTVKYQNVVSPSGQP
jgi:superfamily II DNA or RNA helicase